EDEQGEPIRKGHDIYKLGYAKTFRIRPEDVTKQQRNEGGKTQELALIFGGGVGAYVTFATSFNIDLEAMAKNAVIEERIMDEAENYTEYCVKEKRTLGLSKQVF